MELMDSDSDFDIKIEHLSVKKIIMPLYLAGKTIPEIAKELAIRDHQKLRDAINEFIQKERNKINRERIKNINPEDIFNLRKKGKSIAQICALYNLTSFQIEQIFKKYCIENNIDRKIFHRAKLENVNSNDLVEKIEEGYTLQKLAHEYNVSTTAIRNRILQVISVTKLKELYSKNGKKGEIEEKVSKVIELYGKGISREEISLQVGYGITTVQKILEKEYRKRGKEEVPKIISMRAFSAKINKKGVTRENILKEAEENNVIIPQVFLDNYFGKEEIDVDKIRKFVISQFTDGDLEEEKRMKMFKGFNVAKQLKENGFDLKYQAIALLYLLPNVVRTPMDEIRKVINDNNELMDAIEAIISDETNKEEYFQRIKKCRYAIEVKLAIILEELKEHNLNKEKIDISQYEEYIKMSKHTKFQDEYELAILENKQLFKGNER